MLERGYLAGFPVFVAGFASWSAPIWRKKEVNAWKK
jgi:hypothetical protein